MKPVSMERHMKGRDEYEREQIQHRCLQANHDSHNPEIAARPKYTPGEWQIRYLDFKFRRGWGGKKNVIDYYGRLITLHGETQV